MRVKYLLLECCLEHKDRYSLLWIIISQTHNSFSPLLIKKECGINMDLTSRQDKLHSVTK